MNNVIGTAPSAGGPGAEFFTSAYEEEYDTAPGVFTAQAYDAMAVEIPRRPPRARTTGKPSATGSGPSRTPAARSSVRKTSPKRSRLSPPATPSTTSERRRASTSTPTATSPPRRTTCRTSGTEIVTLDTLEFGNELSEEDLNATAADPSESTASSRRRSAC